MNVHDYIDMVVGIVNGMESHCQINTAYCLPSFRRAQRKNSNHTLFNVKPFVHTKDQKLDEVLNDASLSNYRSLLAEPQGKRKESC
ncbi:hypothetical protein Ocin01_16700 [Orchesella cincta]|uniref:Uncharacterized protein n=1 Tax=Orchesella cincta TaxID=48709 RepID=A0A1D2MAQ1_ORCCI|nr:hypothetical protein Ocin01_16700 [Orchesella cincta]